MEVPTTLHDRLRTARERAGLRKIDLARKAGLSKSYVSQLEAGIPGKNSPSRLVLTAWAGATGVNADWLETGEGEMILGVAEAQAAYGARRRREDLEELETARITVMEAVQTIIKSKNRLVIQALKNNLEVFMQALGRGPTKRRNKKWTMST